MFRFDTTPKQTEIGNMRPTPAARNAKDLMLPRDPTPFGIAGWGLGIARWGLGIARYGLEIAGHSTNNSGAFPIPPTADTWCI